MSQTQKRMGEVIREDSKLIAELRAENARLREQNRDLAKCDEDHVRTIDSLREALDWIARVDGSNAVVVLAAAQKRVRQTLQESEER